MNSNNNNQPTSSGISHNTTPTTLNTPNVDNPTPPLNLTDLQTPPKKSPDNTNAPNLGSGNSPSPISQQNPPKKGPASKEDFDRAKESRDKGNHFWVVGDLEGALRRYTECIQLDPQPEYYRNRAATNIVLERFEDAFSDAKEALKMDNSAKSHYRLAEVFFFMGIAQKEAECFEGATTQFALAYQKEPDVEEVRESLEKAQYYLTWIRTEQFVKVTQQKKIIS